MRVSFLDSAYTSVFAAISRHYTKYNLIPTFEDLEISLREGNTSKLVATIKLLDVDEIDANVAVDALLDQFTQSEAIRQLDGFVDKLPLLDTAEIKDSLSTIVLNLDEKTLTTEGVITMRDMAIFQHDEEHIRNTIYLGINNTLDAAQISNRQSLTLIGGKRGAGKSIAVNNVMVNQYEQGNSCLYFSIEMPGYEVLQRTISILANVNHTQLKHNKLTAEEVLKVVKCRAGMFEDANDLVQEFLETQDRFKFEERLQREKQLKAGNQMVIIDDRALTLSAIDLHIGKFKARFEDKLTTVVVDYMNQVIVEGSHNKLDWQPQIMVATKLKELARKYDVAVVSPYQIDDTGVARFAKGILDSADSALLMEAHDKDLQAISFESTKMRSNRELRCTSPINWDTLRISPISIDTPPGKERASTKKTKVRAEGAEDVQDIPWKT